MAKVKYPVILEKGERNYSVYMADNIGCIATGKTPKQTLKRMQEALQAHLDWMKRDGDPIPNPSPVEQVEFDHDTESVHEVEVEI